MIWYIVYTKVGQLSFIENMEIIQGEKIQMCLLMEDIEYNPLGLPKVPAGNLKTLANFDTQTTQSSGEQEELPTG